MTAVICWFDDSGWPWIVADSRFSYPSDSQQILIDEGAKIFSFPLAVRKTWVFGDIVHFANIGLAFAGSTLVAHNTMLCSASVCGNLVLRDTEAMLSLDHIAELIAKLSQRFTRDLAVLRETGAMTEFALTGWCPFRNAWRIFHIMPVVEDDIQTKITEFAPASPDDLLLLGDHKIEVQDEVVKARSKYEVRSLPWWRAPATALMQMLERRQFNSIGGHLQMGNAVDATKGFNLSTIVQPNEIGHPASTFKFLGMDTRDDIGEVGPCFLGISGMPIAK
jgi:hypothetical protein